MKISCIAPSRIPSDTANSIQVMKACQALVQAGHTVELYVPSSAREAYQSGKPWEELNNWYGLTVPFPVFWIPARTMWKRYDFAWQAVNLSLAAGADLIYTWMPQAAVFAQASSRRPVVLEMHDRPAGKIGPLLLRNFTSSRSPKRLVTVSKALADAIQKEQRISVKRDELVIAPNGVDLERYQELPSPAAARSQLGLTEKLSVGYTGHFYRGRGMSVLESLARVFPDVQFLWVGGAPESVAEWKRRLADNRVENVHLTGFVENSRLALYQAAAEILLMPYERTIEGSSGGNSADICSPMKMFEYMAAGRAVITSDLPVIREVLDEHGAVFCPPEDAGAWKLALQALIDNPQKREAMGNHARRLAKDYTWQVREQRILKGLGPGG